MPVFSYGKDNRYMSDRQDNLYDRISELDEEIAGVDARIQAAYEKQITGKNVYQFLLDFDTLYERMTDLEKKQFLRTFIESIELCPEEKVKAIENAMRHFQMI